jgi:phosphatidate cytidylyltransferase
VTAGDHWRGQAREAAPAASGTSARNLTLRTLSSIVLAPVVLLLTYAGGWLFLGLCTVAAAGILWEWMHLIDDRGGLRVLAVGMAAVLAASVLVGANLPGAAVWAIAAGAVLAGALGARGLSAAAREGGFWAAGGMLYAGIGFLSPALLRRDPEWGFMALLFLFATVWATDIFAFLCGRTIGGPLLWPKVSPKKTWAGAVGGLAGGVAGAVVVAFVGGVGSVVAAGALGLLFSILAQVGDLFESAVKRRFGAKDASRLIPGHGGLMDRLDGFLVAAFAALLIGIARQGIDAPARGFLLW